MTASAWGLLALFLAVLALLAWPLGRLLAALCEGRMPRLLERIDIAREARAVAEEEGVDEARRHEEEGDEVDHRASRILPFFQPVPMQGTP